MIEKLEALRDNLLAEQRLLLLGYAQSPALPPDRALAHIANLEQTINATQALIDEMKAEDRARH